MTSSGGLESLITCDLLLEMARDVTYARGHAYAQEGRVRELSIEDGVLTARVDGSETYRVRLFRQGTRLDFDCTCPVGNELRFCKHCVAAGLAWLMAQGTVEDGEGVAGHPPKADALERVHAFLEGMDAPALRGLLLAEARMDDEFRDRMLLREHAQAQHAFAPDRVNAHSELVRVFLREGDADAAWREAVEGGCSDELWLQLAQKREATHPADALGVYRRLIDAVLVTTGDRAYAAAVGLLPRVRSVTERVGEDFGAYLAGLRETHKRRRKLMEMLDRFERRAVAA